MRVEHNGLDCKVMCSLVIRRKHTHSVLSRDRFSGTTLASGEPSQRSALILASPESHQF